MKSSFSELAEMEVEGELAVIWFNQYSGTCIKSDDTTVVVDPVEVETDEIFEADPDIVLISHEHFDHFDGDIIGELKSESEIITNKTVANELDFEPEIMRPNDSLKRKRVTITAIRSDHPGEEPLTFLLEFESLSVYHAIDSRPHEEMEGLKPDVLIVPIGIAPGVTARTGVEMTDVVNPRLVIPHHTRQGFEEFSNQVEDVEIEILEKGKIFRWKG